MAFLSEGGKMQATSTIMENSTVTKYLKLGDNYLELDNIQKVNTTDSNGNPKYNYTYKAILKVTGDYLYFTLYKDDTKNECIKVINKNFAKYYNKTTDTEEISVPDYLTNYSESKVYWDLCDASDQISSTMSEATGSAISNALSTISIALDNIATKLDNIATALNYVEPTTDTTNNTTTNE